MTDHSSHRYEALDAMRGIAAVTVLISHLTPYGLMSDMDLWADLNWLPIRILWGGHQAVILFFVLGALVAKFRSGILSSSVTNSQTTKLIALFIALGLYMYPFDNPWNAGERILGDFVIMLGSGALLILALTTRSILTSSLLRFLGRISFSLYLTHHACIAVAKWLTGAPDGNNLALWIVSIALSFPAAYLMYVTVERPSLQLGRWIRRKSHPSPSTVERD